MTDGAVSGDRFGSDVVARLLGVLGFEYIALNPGATFRGLHDSLVHSDALVPRIVTCAHEEISVAIAHGYAKAAGRPMAAALHDVVGLQHACMAIYNAWCDRVPMLLLGGTGPVSADRRRPWIDWIHTALVQGNHVRDFVKWDDQPASVPAAVESLVRAWRLTATAPQAPVYVCLPVEVQEDPWSSVLPMPDLDAFRPSRAGPDPDAIREAARLLLGAQRPVVLADRAADFPGALDALRSVAELLGAPILDGGARMNIATDHPLDMTGAEDEVLSTADVLLGIEMTDLAGWLARAAELRPEAARPAVIHITMADALVGSWTSDYQRLPTVDVPILSDAGLALEALGTRLATGANEGHRAAARDRAEQVRVMAATRRERWFASAREHHDDTPISTSRLASEVGTAIDGHPWLLAHGTLGGWARRLWTWREPGSYLGVAGGGGIGYGPGATIGAALARPDRLIVNLQPDGDLLFTPSALWTMAHERLPILNIVWNNRSYFNSEEHARRIGRQRDRGVERAAIGTRIEDPTVDFAGMARSFGLHAEGPIERPQDLPGVLQRAVRSALDGRPSLIDVVTQAR